MANPADQGTFDYWITDRISFIVAPPKSGNTGDFDKWITDRIQFHEYAEQQAEATRIPRYGFTNFQIPGIV